MSACRPDGFEAWPRSRLRLKLDRRQVLLFVWTELKVAARVRDGGAARKLPDLGTMPDPFLELLVPCLSRDHRVEEWNGVMLAHPIRGGEPVEMFRAVSPAAQVLSLMDATLTLAGVADRFAAATGWDRGLAFAYVRGVFLHLVSLGVCQPCSNVNARS